MTPYQVIELITVFAAVAVLLTSILIIILENRNHPQVQGGPGIDLTRPELLRNLRNRYLLILGIAGLFSGIISYFGALSSGLAFLGGALLILLIAALSGIAGIDQKRFLAVMQNSDSEPWSEPQPASLALGLILAAVSYIGVWLVVHIWPDPLVLLYFAIGGLMAAFAARIGGSLMVLAYNASFERIYEIAGNAYYKKLKPEAESRYIALDHGGLAAEFAVLYLGVMCLALGLGILDSGSNPAVNIALVQMMAVASLVSGLGLLLGLRGWKAREDRTSLLNKGILASAVLVLAVGIATGYIFFKSAVVNIVWPIAAAFVILFITAAILQYNTSRRYKTVKNLARLSTYGPAILNLGGNSLGMGGMIMPLLLLALLAVLADGAGSGKSPGTACIVLAAGFIASLAPLLTPYYFADEARDICMVEPYGPRLVKSGEELLPRRQGALAANLLGSLTIISVGLATLASLGLLLRLGKESTLYAVSIFMVLAYFAGGVLAVAVQALLHSSTRTMLVEILDIYRRPDREIAAGRQQWNDDIYTLHCSGTRWYGMVHPWLPLLLLALTMGLGPFLLGTESIIPMMLAFAAAGMGFMLWLEITGAAWMSAYKFIKNGNYVSAGSDSYWLAHSYAWLGLIYRQIVVPALRILLMMALFGSLLLILSGVQF